MEHRDPIPDSELPGIVADDEMLAAYVEGQMAGLDVAAHYPVIHQRLQTSAEWRERRDLLMEMMQAYAAGAYGPSPSYVAAPVQPSGIWRLEEKVHELAETVSIRMRQAANRFADLPALLQPNVQLMPVPVTARERRERDALREPEKSEAVEVLELPDSDANLSVTVSMLSPPEDTDAPIETLTGALVLRVKTLSPPQPVEQASVTLRNPQGERLETASTDEDGLVVLDDLPAGKYGVEVEHANQTWRFSVTLA